MIRLLYTSPVIGRLWSLVAELPPKTDAPGIKANKYKDLQELLQFIPPCNHLFYNTLQVRQAGQQPRRRVAEAEPDDDDDDHEALEEGGDLILDSDSE